MGRDLVRLLPGHPNYPRQLVSRYRDSSPPTLTVVGNVDIFRHDLLALLCSVKCPGDLIVKAYDLARQLRDSGVPVIGGFHSPLERECLALLLRGRQPVVICPARSLEAMRLPRAWQVPLAEGRLLIASPFEAAQPRITAALADVRNELVAAIASAVLVVYAAPGGRTERLCLRLVGAGKRLCALDSRENVRLSELGIERGRPNCRNDSALGREDR